MFLEPTIRALAAVVVVTALGCGGRDPLETGFYSPAGTAGASAASGGQTNGSGGSSSSTGGSGVVSSGGVTGTGGFVVGMGGSFGVGGGGVIATGRQCVRCATTQCPELTACLLDSACRRGMLCTATTCVTAGGTPDPQCVNDCFNGDSAAALRAIAAFGCLVTQCATSCRP